MGKASGRKERQRDRLHEQQRSNRRFTFAVLGVVVILVAAIAMTIGVREGTTTEGERGEIERSGSASALGIEADAKTVGLGHVPLNTTVQPSWRLVNRSASSVSLGKPHAEVVEGCCPGPLQLGTDSLAPGEATDLTFPLQMHEGMDGPHDFNIHVPVRSAEGEALLELRTTGHFSD